MSVKVARLAAALRSWRAKADPGFVLPVVLVAAGLMTAAVLTLSTAVRTHVRVVAGAREMAVLSAFADAGVMLAIRDLTADPLAVGTPRYARDRSVTRCQLPGGDAIAVRIDDEAGKVDLNIAGSELLGALLLGAGDRPELVEAHVAAILDYRDHDDIRSISGAERSDYAAAGRDGPRNAAFVAFEEVGEVLGLPPDLVARLAPHVTVYSGQEGVDPAAASIELLGLLARDQRPTGADRDRPALAPRFTVASVRQAFTIVAAARGSSGAILTRRAIVARPAGATTPVRFIVRRWWGGGSLGDEANPPGAARLAPC